MCVSLSPPSAPKMLDAEGGISFRHSQSEMKLNPKVNSGFNKFTKAAIEAAFKGGEVLKSYFDKEIKINFKGKIDPVTEADRLSQEKIVNLIRKKFHGHSTIGEEGGESACSAEYCWIIDPLDGTVNFIHHLPIFCVSIGLLHDGKIISGVVHAPILNETFVAEKGGGAWLNGKRIEVSKTGSLLRALAVTGFPYYIHSKPNRAIKYLVNVITKVQGLRRLGSAALDLAYVAMGRFDAFWELGLSPWDVAAGSLLVDEAGGKVSDLKKGSDYVWGKSILASNGTLHKKLLKLFSDKGKRYLL